MEKLVRGIKEFQSTFAKQEKELFERLSKGQQPEVLFITCSDSRIATDLITQSKPGDIFVVRNAGNIVPAHRAANGGEGASIEFAVAALGVKHIILCGHTQCGAMKGLLQLDQLQDLPAVASWLMHADATRRIVRENYAHLEGEALLKATIEENVLVQLENLKTHPAVASRLVNGTLHLHAWVYKIETGQVFTFDSEEGQYVLLSEVSKGLEPAARQLEVNI